MSRLILLLLLYTFKVNAQHKYTLDECINYALTHNADLRNTKLQSKEKELDLRYQKHKFLPSAQVYINSGLKSGLQSDVLEKSRRHGNYYNEFTLETSIPLFSSDASFYIVKKYESDVDIANLSYSYKELELKLNVLEKYYNVAIAKIRCNISQTQVMLQDSICGITKKLFKIGRKAQKDVIDAELNLSQDKYNAHQEKNNVESSLKKLANAMSYNDTLDVVVSENNFLLPSLSFDTIANNIVQKHPSVVMTEKMIESSKRELKIFVRQHLPSLSLNYEFGTGALWYYDEQNTNVKKQWDNNAYHMVALSLRIPILNQLNTRTQIKKSKVLVERNRELLIKTKEDIFNEIEQIFTDIQHANTLQEDLNVTVKLADEQYKHAINDYRLGNIASYELNIYKNRYLSSILQLAQIKCELEYKYCILKYLIE